MKFEIYVNKDSEFGGDRDYVLISKDGGVSGCLIKHPRNSIGYSTSWNDEFFKKADKNVTLDVSNHNFHDNKLYIEGNDKSRSKCVIDFESMKIMRNIHQIEEFKKILHEKNNSTIILKVN